MGLVEFSQHGDRARITLNRPDKRNALSPEMISDLTELLNGIRQKPEIKTVMITGAGTSFCAGADLAYLRKLAEFSPVENEKDSQAIEILMRTLYELPKVTIAAVQGPAIAGGCGLATACDFIVADQKNARFGYTEVRIGFLPAIVAALLVCRTGMAKARQLLLRGNILTAEQAEQFGLVDVLTDDVLRESESIAEDITKNSGQSIFQTKHLLTALDPLPAKSAGELAVYANTLSRNTQDFKDGLDTFLNKKGR